MSGGGLIAHCPNRPPRPPPTGWKLLGHRGWRAQHPHEIVHGTRSITADTALRLARYFGTSERFWLNLQAHYDLETEKDRLGRRLEKEVVRRAV
ncbi:MAG: HigA family addiction module antidote protein [Gemmatimonadetes bacterium]|nr:HigA family addiction module antidote protein [Gemmatimonadota bacterium]